MNILLVGSGGREHALAWKLSQSAHTDKLYAVPGNPGIAQFAECVSGISVEDNDAIVALAKEKNIGLVVVGPEVPLVNGVVDQAAANDRIHRYSTFRVSFIVPLGRGFIHYTTQGASRAIPRVKIPAMGLTFPEG